MVRSSFILCGTFKMFIDALDEDVQTIKKIEESHISGINYF
jgi:hypothetical protein